MSQQPKKGNSNKAAASPATSAAVCNSSNGDSGGDLAALVLERNTMDSHIEQLRAELAASEQQRFALDCRIQLIELERATAADPVCAEVGSSFAAARRHFESTLATPTNYDNEVPFRCSDDFADTSGFDDWLDAQLERCRERYGAYSQASPLSASSRGVDSGNSGGQPGEDAAGALRVLLRTSELLQEQLRAVEAIDGADAGLLLECRERLVAEWEDLAADLKHKFSEVEQDGGDAGDGSGVASVARRVVDQVSPSLFSVRKRLEQLGKPFSSVFDS